MYQSLFLYHIPQLPWLELCHADQNVCAIANVVMANRDHLVERIKEKRMLSSWTRLWLPSISGRVHDLAFIFTLKSRSEMSISERLRLLNILKTGWSNLQSIEVILWKMTADFLVFRGLIAFFRFLHWWLLNVPLVGYREAFACSCPFWQHPIHFLSPQVRVDRKVSQ